MTPGTTAPITRRRGSILRRLIKPGWFSSLKSYQNVVDAVRLISEQGGVEVFTLSAVLPDSPYAVEEKNLWLDHHAPFIDAAHRLFTSNGAEKFKAVPGGIKQADLLLDDYSVNLSAWVSAMPGHTKAVKLLNGINGTKGTWRGPVVSRFAPPSQIQDFLIQQIFK